MNMRKGEKMKATHRIIVHGLMKVNNKYLVIKRTDIKRGKPNTYPRYWDIPGGMVEERELPRKALLREIKEEVGLDAIIVKIIHEDSNLDEEKDLVFTRLVYLCVVNNDDVSNINLQLDEHDEYRLIDSLEEMKGEKLVEYVVDVLKSVDCENN